MIKNKYKLNFDNMTIDELCNYIINNLDIISQSEIVGREYYNTFINSNKTKRKEMILSSLKQMPEDIIQNIVKYKLYQ